MLRLCLAILSASLSVSVVAAGDLGDETGPFSELARMTLLTHTSALPEVDRIEVVALNADEKPEAGETKFPVGSGDLFVAVHSSLQVDDEKAKRIATDWRELAFRPNSTFCHIPAYGIRFYRGDDLLFSVSVCWKCRNFYIPRIDPMTGQAGAGLYGFDDNAASKRLLNDLKRILPHPEIR